MTETHAPPRVHDGHGPSHTTILVVDDDDLIRDCITESLRLQGFTALAAPNGRVALDIVDMLGPAIDVALVDIRMPDLDGEQTLREIRARVPSMRGILTGGHSAGQISSKQVERGEVCYVQKPYTAAKLIETIQARQPA